MQTAMYEHPLIGPSLVTMILSQGSAKIISKGTLTFLHTSTYSKQTKGITPLSSLIIPICQNHHLVYELFGEHMPGKKEW